MGRVGPHRAVGIYDLAEAVRRENEAVLRQLRRAEEWRRDRSLPSYGHEALDTWHGQFAATTLSNPREAAALERLRAEARAVAAALRDPPFEDASLAEADWLRALTFLSANPCAARAGHACTFRAQWAAYEAVLAREHLRPRSDPSTP